MADAGKGFVATIAIGILIFIGWLAVTAREWEERGCANSTTLAITHGSPEWYEFCMEAK